MDSEKLYERLNEYTPIELKWRERFLSGDYPVTTTRFDDMLGHYVGSWFSKSKSVLVERHSRFFPHYFHAHDFIEIMYLFAGECENISDIDSVKLTPGDLCVVPPGAWHLPMIHGNSILINFCVRTSWLAERILRINHGSVLTSYLRSMNQPQKARYLLVKSHLFQEVKECADRLVAASLDRHEDSEYELECLVEELILKAIHLCGDETVAGEEFSNGELTSNIITIISADYPTLTLEELALRLNYSKAHICRVIRASFGTTFSNIVNQLRIEDSCHLLKMSGLPVSEIAFSCGFTSIEYFTRTFRRYTGMTPSAYRKSGSELPEPLGIFHFRPKIRH